MRIDQYLSLRDGFFETEVYRELRKAGISDEQSDQMTATAFRRAKEHWQEVQDRNIAGALSDVNLPEPMMGKR